MTTAPSTAAGAAQRPLALAERLIAFLEGTPHSLIALLARFGIAGIFWRSGQTKVDGWTVTDSTLFLFAEEYKVPLLPPEAAAYLAAGAEHLFPPLLVLGLATRLSAAALLGMTLVIQLFVYPNLWPDHAVWAAALVYLMARGPGRLSMDHLIRRRVSEV